MLPTGADSLTFEELERVDDGRFSWLRYKWDDGMAAKPGYAWLVFVY